MDKRTLVFRKGNFNDLINVFVDLIKNALLLDKDIKVTIQEYRQTRSHSQNALLWLWLNQLVQYMIATHDLHATGEDWLDVLAERGILPMVVNPVTNKPRRISTTKLNTKEFTQFLERFEHYCGKYHPELNLVHPEDLYYSAMGLN